MTRVLITNDDGIDAPGLRALAEAARAAGHDVVVAAPHQEASGMSAALTAVVADGRIVVERRELGDYPAYAVAASPAYIAVLAGLGVFGPPPDVVLSGINRGANAGHAVLHSGTVGAALTAANNGARAMAVSLDVLNPVAGGPESGGMDSGGARITVPDDSVLHWDTAATFAGELLGWLIAAPERTVLNLNVPDRPADQVSGLRQAALASFGQATMGVAEAGDGYVSTTVEISDHQVEPGTDVALLAEGFAAVTAIRPPAEAGEVHIPAQRTAGR
jgi:5'-nucleotidase